MRVGAALLINSISVPTPVLRSHGLSPALFILAADRHEKEKIVNER